MNEQFGVGSVLGTGFRVYGRNIIAFTLITAILYIPLGAYTMWLVNNIEHQTGSSLLKGAGITLLMTLFLDAFVTATLTYGVVKELQGERASIGKCLAVGFSRMFPVFGVAILAGLAMVALPLVASFLGIAMKSPEATLLLLLLSIIPAIIIACMLYVATPASVIEKPGVFGALSRSRELTSGNKGAIFGIRFMLGLIGFGVGKIEGAMFTDASSLKTFMYVDFGTKIILGAIGSCVAAVAYYSLRATKEGTSANELASVFE
ncbi:MAG: hypothetical protein QM831_23700 [Kofleriaceae bacterium]